VEAFKLDNTSPLLQQSPATEYTHLMQKLGCSPAQSTGYVSKVRRGRGSMSPNIDRQPGACFLLGPDEV
jgi:hypothetical protein